MATIQIRNIPESVHHVYRARAAAAGMSLQEYVLAELVRNAALRTPAELVAEVEARMRSEATALSTRHRPLWCARIGNRTDLALTSSEPNDY